MQNLKVVDLLDNKLCLMCELVRESHKRLKKISNGDEQQLALEENIFCPPKHHTLINFIVLRLLIVTIIYRLIFR